MMPTVPLTKAPIRRLMRANGEVRTLAKPTSIEFIERLLRAQSLEIVSLHDAFRHVLLIDAASITKRLPVNVFATLLYRLACGGDSGVRILGDALLCPDADFEEPEPVADALAPSTPADEGDADGDGQEAPA
jgi:hypothetical protein